MQNETKNIIFFIFNYSHRIAVATQALLIRGRLAKHQTVEDKLIDDLKAALEASDKDMTQ